MGEERGGIISRRIIGEEKCVSVKERKKERKRGKERETEYRKAESEVVHLCAYLAEALYD
jgi:hypothetical protein